MSTLKDVARLAGVSPSTVSRVVNGGSTGAASEETVRRIWDAVRESGYSVNENARSLRMKEEGGVKETLAIDCVFARDLDSFIDPFFMVLMQIIEADAFKRGYRLRYQYPIGDLKSVPLPDAKKKAAAIILGRTDKAHLELRQNHIMTILTVVTTIFMPLTLITGWYGMNFRYMPELETEWGYPLVFGTCILIITGSLIFFKKKKWL